MKHGEVWLKRTANESTRWGGKWRSIRVQHCGKEQNTSLEQMSGKNGLAESDTSDANAETSVSLRCFSCLTLTWFFAGKKTLNFL